MMSTQASPYMSVEAFATYARPDKPLSIQTVYRWIARGLVPSGKIGGMVVVNREAYDRQLASRAPGKAPSLTPFDQARLAVRSLKTEHTVKRHPGFQKGTR